MPKTRHCAQNRQTSITKPLMNTEPTTPKPPQPTTETVNIDDFLSGAVARQDASLQELETRLEAMGDEFAAKVRTMVERGLIAARGKALREIQSIDVSFFTQPDPATLHGHDAHTLEATAEVIQ
jgi:hypothetical protein